MRRNRNICLWVLCCAALLVSCGRQAGYTYQRPAQTDDGWETAALADVGMDVGPLNDLMARIARKEYANVHGIVIVKDGKLVFEEYFDGYAFRYTGPWSSLFKFRGERVEFDADTPHNLASVTKSITSALVGIALDRGYLRAVDEPVFNYLPQYTYLRSKGKDRITVEHLLSMTSGLEWNELELWLGDMEHDLIRLFMVPDPVGFVLAKPLTDEPGSRWYYNGGGVNVLGEVLREATGLRLDAFAERYLFAPLGITDYDWDKINADTIHASGSLKLRPRDAAKFGSLYLNGGRWQGKQIVPAEWVDASTAKSVSVPWGSLAGNLHEQYAEVPKTHGDGYGYLWWLKTYRVDGKPVDAIQATGWGGQWIGLFPDLDMAVVLTGGNYATHEPVQEILTRHVLPAVQRGAALRSPTGQAEMGSLAPSATAPAASPTPSGTPTPLTPSPTATSSPTPRPTRPPPTVTPEPGSQGTVLMPFGHHVYAWHYEQVRREFERAGYNVVVASDQLGPIEGLLSVSPQKTTELRADLVLEDVQVADYDAVVFITDYGLSTGKYPHVYTIAQEALAAGRVLAAYDFAPLVLGQAGLLKGVRATAHISSHSVCESLAGSYGAICTYSSKARDGNIVTADGVACPSLCFVRAVLEALREP